MKAVTQDLYCVFAAQILRSAHDRSIEVWFLPAYWDHEDKSVTAECQIAQEPPRGVGEKLRLMVT